MDLDHRINYLMELGCDIAWKYEDTQSGYIRFSVIEPDNHEYLDSITSITEIPIQEVPQWAIHQLEI